MTYIINTDEYGKIEINTTRMIAYHYLEGIGYPINESQYYNFMGVLFDILWAPDPRDPKSELILRVRCFKEIGRSE